MSIQASRIAATIDYDKDGFQAGSLQVPHSVDRSAYGHIPIPIAMVKNGTGPTVLLTGGNHGDEYEGPIALMKLLQHLPGMSVQGRIIVVPGLNFPALLAGKRTSPIDHANMNRVFPGRHDGTITELIAHYVDTELVPRADVILDIHAGGKSFDHMPMLLINPPADDEGRASYMALVESFAAPHAMVMDLLGEDRTYGAAAERQGKTFLCGEFGGYGTCNPECLKIVEEGLARLLSHVGVMQGGATPEPRHQTAYLRVAGRKHYVFTSVSGIFEPAVRLGDRVEEGQPAGRVFNPHAPWDPPCELVFGASGICVCIRAIANVEPGDCVFLVASDTPAP